MRPFFMTVIHTENDSDKTLLASSLAKKTKEEKNQASNEKRSFVE
jgi:hypothetical protein